MIEIVIAVFVSVVMASASPATIWGGDHIEMQVTDRGATIEFDCAHGTIDTAIAPDAAGRFEIAGTFTPERGAAREETSQTLKATYAGTVVDDTMTLRLTVAGQDAAPVTYELTRGRAGHIRKCR